MLKKNKYNKDKLLKKINDKAIFGKDIKNSLMVNEFPIENNILESNKNNDIINNSDYDEIYILKKRIEINNINSNNENQMNNNSIKENINLNEIINKIKDLDSNMNKIGQKLEKKIDEKFKSMEARISKLENLCNILINYILDNENKTNENINNNY